MGVRNISHTEKSAPSSIERQGNVDCFFRVWGSCLSYICTSWTDSE
jgi:hypothetical protein